MINHLTGTPIIIESNHIAIESSGTGWGVKVDSKTFEEIKEAEDVTLLIHEKISETEFSFFGFLSEHDRKLFRLLITVQGVGGNTALLVMSDMNESEIKEAVIRKDANRFGAIKGIGPKTAKVIIETIGKKLKAKK